MALGALVGIYLFQIVVDPSWPERCSVVDGCADKVRAVQQGVFPLACRNARGFVSVGG